MVVHTSATDRAPVRAPYADPNVLEAHFQPIVELGTGRVAAYEALVRGGPQAPLHNPAELFGAAARDDTMRELDDACRVVARRDARAQGIGGAGQGTWLFVNVEPDTLAADPDGVAASLLREDGSTGNTVIEVTERALATDPARLLSALDRVRSLGFRVALDDLGTEPATLALLPIVQPEVVKLDLSIVQRPLDVDLGCVVDAVLAYTERSKALVLAEGIETAEHEERAVAFGAHLGQGWRYGRPARHVNPTEPVADLQMSRMDPLPAEWASAFDAVVASGRPTRVARKDVLLTISEQFERQAVQDPERPVILSAFQHARNFTGATARRYGAMVSSLPMVVALGVDLPSEPVPGVRGAHIAHGDPLTGEWSVVVLGNRHCGALVARDLGDDGEESRRRFEFCITHDRQLVGAAARALLGRVVRH